MKQDSKMDEWISCVEFLCITIQLPVNLTELKFTLMIWKGAIRLLYILQNPAECRMILPGAKNTAKSQWVYLFSPLIIYNHAVVLNIILTVNTCGYYDIQDSGIIALVIFINALRLVPKNAPNGKLTVTLPIMAYFFSIH